MMYCVHNNNEGVWLTIFFLYDTLKLFYKYLVTDIERNHVEKEDEEDLIEPAFYHENKILHLVIRRKKT